MNTVDLKKKIKRIVMSVTNHNICQIFGSEILLQLMLNNIMRSSAVVVPSSLM